MKKWEWTIINFIVWYNYWESLKEKYYGSKIKGIKDCMNNYPKKLFNGKSSNEIYEKNKINLTHFKV